MILRTSIRRLSACAATAVLLVFSIPSCAGSRPIGRNTAMPVAVPVLSVDYVLSPPHGDLELELQDLAPLHDQAANLRRAFLLLPEQPQTTLELCAEVLHGGDTPSPVAEAMARYLRAEAFVRLGKPERGEHDRARAHELAIDPDLRARLERLPGARTGARVAAPTAALSLPLQRRANWQASAAIPIRLDPMEHIYRLTVHHSAMYFRDTSPATCAAQIQQIQRAHMNQERRYGDIGYHFLIDPAGRVWEGRDLKWQGAHARGDNNRGNIGVCVLGNFVRGRGGQQPNEVQLQALKQLIVDLQQRYRFGSQEIHSHSDFVTTECPGPYLAAAVAGIARELQVTAARDRAPASD